MNPVFCISQGFGVVSGGLMFGAITESRIQGLAPAPTTSRSCISYPLLEMCRGVCFEIGFIERHSFAKHLFRYWGYLFYRVRRPFRCLFHDRFS
jgi:hypothetical protein